MNGVVRLDGGFGLDITCCGLLLESCADSEKTIHVVGCYLKVVQIRRIPFMLLVFLLESH